jgi:hypothetical protein
MIQPRRSVLVILGVVVHLVLWWTFQGVGNAVVGDPHTPDVPIWFSLLSHAFVGFHSVAPAFAIGWFAGVGAARLGALVGFLGSLMQTILFSLQYPLVALGDISGLSTTVVTVLSFTLTPTLVGAVSALAGEFLRFRRHAL